MILSAGQAKILTQAASLAIATAVSLTDLSMSRPPVPETGGPRPTARCALGRVCAVCLILLRLKAQKGSERHGLELKSARMVRADEARFRV